VRDLSTSTITNRFFVYGTLKRGECRQTLWPFPPLEIRTGYVRGRLYDLGEYPALWTGDCEHDEDAETAVGETAWDWIEGEAWVFSDADMMTTIRKLDEIEQTDQPGFLNLYDRILVRVHDQAGFAGSELAYAYQYSTGSWLDDRLRVPGRRTDQRRLGDGADVRVAAWPVFEETVCDDPSDSGHDRDRADDKELFG